MPLRALRFQPEDEDGMPVMTESKTQTSKSVWLQTLEGLKSKCTYWNIGRYLHGSVGGSSKEKAW
ncbi:MAG: hypothetical protein ACLU4J_03835 [Butyricimonas paravirosa]